MIIRCLITTLIWLLVCLPATLVGFPVVAVLLHTKWDGKTTIFGNAQWGRATNHPINPTKGFWSEFLWLTWRNPVNNLYEKYLSLRMKPYDFTGDLGIGDHLKGGSYSIRMGWAWEYYLIKLYVFLNSKRCIRMRMGWKIGGNLGVTVPFVFTINLWKIYNGK